MTARRHAELKAGAAPTEQELGAAISDAVAEMIRQEYAPHRVPETTRSNMSPLVCAATVDLLVKTAPPQQRRAMWELLHPPEPVQPAPQETTNGD